MSKKTIIFGIALIVLAISVIVLFVVVQAKKANSPEHAFTLKDTGPKVDQVIVPDSEELNLITPTGGSVKVNNFYKFAAFIAAPSVYLYDSPEYSIIFSESTKDFDIVLYAYDAKEANSLRAQAQNDFINILGISEAEACQLPVLLEIPYSYNQELSGKNYGLSFCPEPQIIK